MTAWPAPGAVDSSTALLERAISYTRGSLALVTPELLERPTPCAEWDLADLLAHMNDGMLALCDAVVTRRVGLHPAPDDPDVGVAAVSTLRQRACALLSEWSRLRADAPVEVGGLAMPASLVGLTGSLEIAVHGWDVATACGAEWPIPGALAELLLEAAPMLVDPSDRGDRFAAPVSVPDAATASDRLLAFTGRAPA